MLKLKRLKIEKYRSVKPGTELHFRDSLNVILGRNGTGKTTLLSLIVQILSWDFSQMQGEPIDLDYELRSSKGQLLVQVRSGSIQETLNPLPNSVRSAVDVMGLRLRPSNSRYSVALEVIAFENGEKQGLLRVEGTQLVVEDGYGKLVCQISGSNVFVDRFTLSNIIVGLSSFEGDSKKAMFEWIRRFTGHPMFLRRFDESLGYLDYIAQDVRYDSQKFEVSGGIAHFVTSTDDIPAFSERIRAGIALKADEDSFKLESGEEGAEFLDRIVELLGGRSAQIRIQRISRSSGPDEHTVFGNIRFEFIRRDGSLVNHTLLSYGQKRLVAFYCYLAVNPGFAVADELVNGMHHEWIEACLEDLDERQSFLTSQNPLLLDYLVFESVEEVQDSFVLCRTDLHDEREQWIWGNMSDADADGFFKAYQVAIQHVSELLRTRGLW